MIQAMLTMNVLKVAEASTTVKAVMDSNKARGVQFVADRILNSPATAGRGGGRGGPPLTPDQQNSLERGGVIYAELCYSCHGADGRGTPTPGAAAWFHPGAVAGRVGTRQRPSRLRDQDPAARALRSGGRQGLSAGHGGDGHEQGPVDCGHQLVCAQQLREHRHVRDRRRTSRGSVLPRAIGKRHGPSRSWMPPCHGRSSPMPRGKSQPATRADRRRRRTPKGATTSSAMPRAHSTSWAGRRACRNKPACGSRLSCPRRLC